MKSQTQKYLTEFIGAFFFLYIIISTGGNPIAVGGALGLSVYLGGKISGGNFNPAVTIMMAAANKMPAANVLPYIIAQIAGGLLAFVLYKAI